LPFPRPLNPKLLLRHQDEPAFEEVLEYGRALRQADRPAEDDGP
jgi:hypothetical protein